MKNNLFVIDTNTLISSSLNKYSITRKAFNKANQTGRILASIETFEEFRETFTRSKFEKYISLTERLVVINELNELSLFHKVAEKIKECRDPKDDKFLALAVAANASCLITGDKDLLVLHPFRNIPILNASDFINHF